MWSPSKASSRYLTYLPTYLHHLNSWDVLHSKHWIFGITHRRTYESTLNEQEIYLEMLGKVELNLSRRFGDDISYLFRRITSQVESNNNLIALYLQHFAFCDKSKFQIRFKNYLLIDMHQLWGYNTISPYLLYTYTKIFIAENWHWNDNG